MTDQSTEDPTTVSRVAEIHRGLTAHQQSIGEVHLQLANLYESMSGEPAKEGTTGDLEAIADQLHVEHERLLKLVKKVEYMTEGGAETRTSEDGTDDSPSDDGGDPFDDEGTVLNTDDPPTTTDRSQNAPSELDAGDSPDGA